MRRLVVLASAAAGAVLASITAAAVLALELGGCYVGWVPLPDRPLCGSGLWGAEELPFYVLAVTTVVALTSAGLLVVTLRAQFLGARVLARRLASLTTAVPAELAVAVDAVGVTRLRCVRLDTPLAITVGSRRPEVVVSDALVAMLEPAELEAVLHHEAEHQRRRHPALFGVARSAAAAARVLPALGELARRIEVAAEVAADAAAVRHAGRRPLVSALAKLSSVPRDGSAIAVGSVAGHLDERVRTLAGRPLDPRLTTRQRLLTALGAVVIVAPVVAVVSAYVRAHGILG